MALAWPSLALAQDRPPPLRLDQDVAITSRYTLTGAAEGAGVRPDSVVGQMLHSAGTGETRHWRQSATGRVRTGGMRDSEGFEIIDARARRMWRYIKGPGTSRQVLELFEGDDVGLPTEEASQDPDYLGIAHREGTDTVAGIPCTNWRLRGKDDPETEAILACFAANGLVLRSTRRSGPMTEVTEAVRVEYGPLDPALFAPPPGWKAELRKLN